MYSNYRKLTQKNHTTVKQIVGKKKLEKPVQLCHRIFASTNNTSGTNNKMAQIHSNAIKITLHKQLNKTIDKLYVQKIQKIDFSRRTQLTDTVPEEEPEKNRGF